MNAYAPTSPTAGPSGQRFEHIPKVPLPRPEAKPGEQARWLVLPVAVWFAIVVGPFLALNESLRGSMCCLSRSPTVSMLSFTMAFAGALWALHLAVVGVSSILFRRAPLSHRAVGPVVLITAFVGVVAFGALVLAR